VDINAISQTIARALAAAGLNTTTGPLRKATAAIDAALAAAGLPQHHAPVTGADTVADTAPKAREAAAPSERARPPAAGQFLSLAHQGSAGSRAYKLYGPAGHDGTPMPLIVMLHGCKQNPDDFAAGTRMNELAEREGFMVAYPAQTARANGANCWNWFESSQQRRDGIEPSLIVGIVADIVRSHAADPARVFVAGLSAGAAMAVILGAVYPEVFAGVAAHSGLPLGVAHDVGSAFAAMQGRGRSAPLATPVPALPTIVFHGDADQTVAALNGSKIVEQALRAHAESGQVLQATARPPRERGRRAVTIIDHVDADGRPRVEEWLVHGGSHAWSGGSPQGSYTDATGPDASAAIVRFFLSRPS
jgi:poly(hydroxyalkanoate) depolymerase family esterase